MRQPLALAGVALFECVGRCILYSRFLYVSTPVKESLPLYVSPPVKDLLPSGRTKRATFRATMPMLPFLLPSGRTQRATFQQQFLTEDCSHRLVRFAVKPASRDGLLKTKNINPLHFNGAGEISRKILKLKDQPYH